MLWCDRRTFYNLVARREVQGEKVYLQLYFMETNKYYSQVLVWTDQEHKASLSSEFRDMAYSLKEVE